MKEHIILNLIEVRRMEFAKTLENVELDIAIKLAEAKAESADPNTKYLPMKEVFEGLRERYSL